MFGMTIGATNNKSPNSTTDPGLDKQMTNREQNIGKLKEKEGVSVIAGLAMMSYNPSIGRVLEKGGVDKFSSLMVEKVKQLHNISNQAEFDEYHDSIVGIISKKMKTARGEGLSYGQAQKPVNVFFKVYVDWASLPDPEKAHQLRRLIHVPLDSILMKAIKTKFPVEYEEYVLSRYDSIRDNFKRYLIEEGKEVHESSLRKRIDPSNLQLSQMYFKEMYYAWQFCARAIYPEKPVLIDVYWYLGRKEDNGSTLDIGQKAG